MLKLISLNVERSRYLSRQLTFFVAEKPDVLCLQEAFEADLERIQEVTEMPYMIWEKDTLTSDPSNSSGVVGYSGQAIFSRTPFVASGSAYYYMPEGGITLESKGEHPPRETNAQNIVWAEIEKTGECYRIANTHFTWAARGGENANQQIDFLALSSILGTIGPHILVGDLNAPRGKGVWERFASLYDKDNIPEDIVTTIDQELHRKKGLRLVVDGLFTPIQYTAEGVRVMPGLSDHQAIVAMVRKR